MGRFVGTSDNVGHAITFKILTESKRVIYRSVVRSGAGKGAFVNLRANRKAPRMAPPVLNKALEFNGVKYPVFIDKIHLAKFKEDLGQFADEEPKDHEHVATVGTTPTDAGELQTATAPDLEDGNHGPLVTNDESCMITAPGNGESRSRLKPHS